MDSTSNKRQSESVLLMCLIRLLFFISETYFKHVICIIFV